jgi:hypothetical protein
VSISINTQNGYDYSKYLNENQSKATDKQGQYAQFLNDYLNISNDGMQGYNGVQPTQFLPTGNYGPALTTDQEKTILTKLQSKFSSTDSASSSKFAQARSTIKDDLKDFDASTATDNQVDTLFKQVTATLKGTLPSNGSSLSAFGLSNLNSTGSKVSVDDMKSFLMNLVDKMSSVDSTSTQNTLDPFSGLDPSSTTDDQTQNLFDLMSGASGLGLDNPILQQGSTNTDFPPILQTSGVALPPFNWKPTVTPNA